MVPRPRIPSLPIAGALVAAACLTVLPATMGQGPVAPPLHVAGVAPPGMPLPPARTPKPPDAILVASFNIQVFGESKLAKPAVVDVLARVVRHFDVVAIQEVRAKSDGILPAFVQAVNADGSRYQFVLGPRLGRTVSKEQYAFVYDTERIEVDPASVGTVPDPGNRLHRPPLHARFRTRIIPVEMAFTFWLVDIHTDPDEVPQEVDALADVFSGMKSARPDEDDVILLGDLNAAPQQFGRMKQLPNVAWAITSGPTNTHRTKTYDNLVFDQVATREYLGRWGVFDLQSGFGLSLQQALEVSDHCPVWGAFYPAEAPPAGAAGAIAAGAATAPR